MLDELAELLDTAIYREIASQALYAAAQSKTQDSGARALMKELAEEELKHSQWLKKLKDQGVEVVEDFKTVPNGTMLFLFRDIEGNLIQLVERNNPL